MYNKKPYIKLYTDSAEQWKMLSNEQAGELVKALLKYAETGEKLDSDDGMLKMAFLCFVNRIENQNIVAFRAVPHT